MEAPVPIYITLPAEYFPVNVSPMVEIDMGKQQGQVPAVAKPGKKPIVVASAAPSEKVRMPLSENKPLAPAEPQSSVGSDDDECSSMDELISSRGKKRRLDHLTWEEKLQRKKLKNRVAAQTSRDRKKAKMEEMEKTIQEQAEQISELQDRCNELAAEKSDMHGKYLALERRFEELQRRLEAQDKERSKNGILHRVGQSLAAGASDDDEGSVGCATAGRLMGSAASPRCPLQQGLNKDGPAEAQTTLPPSTSDERLTALWKIIAICLLYRTCSKISTCPSSKSLPKAYSQVSAQTWKALIAQAARLMPKAAAPASACLDQWWGPHQQSWNPVDRPHCPLIREAA